MIPSPMCSPRWATWARRFSTSLGSRPLSTCFSSSAGCCLVWASLWRLSTWRWNTKYGRANIKSTMLNVLKGFFAANLVTVVPVNLYTFCISLQNVFLKDLAADYVGAQSFNLGEVALKVLAAKFGPPTVGPALGLLNLLTPHRSGLLRAESVLRQHQTWRDSVDSDGGGQPVPVQRPPGLHRWVQPMVQADLRSMPDCFPPNCAVVPGPAHVPGQLAVGPGHHAGGWGKSPASPSSSA